MLSNNDKLEARLSQIELELAGVKKLTEDLLLWMSENVVGFNHEMVQELHRRAKQLKSMR